MLSFFTDPYKDELLYSSIARYHFYSGNIDIKDTLEELFLSRSVTSSIEVGSRFSTLVQNIGENYSVESILADHTIYSYYSPFISSKRQQEVINDVKGKGSGLYSRLGMVAGGICRKNGLYYCSQCANEDIEKYGEPFIHREHQLQGIEYCAHHGLKLKKYILNPRLESKYEYIRFDKRKMDLVSLSPSKEEQNEIGILQVKLAKMAYHLLQIPINKFSREIIELRYRTLFRERNLLTLENKVRKKELYEAFELKFPNGFLEKYECSLDIKDTNNWLRIITRNINRHVHPFRHLLMIYFLDHDIESFFLVKPDQGPFGSGPWPCLNKASIHYKQNVVNDMRIKRDYYSKNPVGEFSCSCGYVYVRKGPDIIVDDRYRINYIKDYGDAWIAQVQDLNKKGLSAKKIAKQLETSSVTVIKHLKYRQKMKSNNCANKEILIAKYRVELLEATNRFPSYSRTELKGRFKKKYSFLSLNDKEWFNANMPKKRKKVQVQTVDWNMRDQEYYEKIQALHKELLELDKPVRITRSTIGRRLNILDNIEKTRVIKLPHTNRLLNEINESVQDFQIRRCFNVIDQLLEDDEPIALWKVQKMGAVKLHHFNEIKLKLEEYIQAKLEMKHIK
ncbi:transposase [Psychrobacillus glaciei]|uniref:Transposase n=1 Tax=Psychrobacillus glaciei TaxID=2283160 RepID=A0A5J6ST57_9BACI|nr:transposase [Psychrobacillus glaciei]